MTQFTRRRFLRGFLAGTLAAGSATSRVAAAPFARPVGANDDIRVGVVGLGQLGGPGVGARGKQLIDLIRQVPGARIVALCDVDAKILSREVERFKSWQENVTAYRDMRRMFESPDVDAVFVATPNHWHALATIWACQAGKDVYVEKPASYSLWEGRQMVAAATRFQRVVQVGTQARSEDTTAQAVEYLQAGELGKLLYAQAIVYRRRDGIGHADGPLSIPPSVDYDLWLGPAARPQLPRRVFHYDWHWFWNTGNGEIGNNGVHYLDRSRWLLGQKGLPRRAVSIGGRFVVDDDAQTPNTQIALFDCEPAPILCEVRNLPDKTGSRRVDRVRGIDKGMIVQCEGGYYREGAVFDAAGREIKRFVDRRPRELQASAHQANFLDAVRSRQRGNLTADIVEGHYSAALAHLANTSYRLGSQVSQDELEAHDLAAAPWSDACQRMMDHLAANGVDLGKQAITRGPWLTLDTDNEVFTGDFAKPANALAKRDYRQPYVVPDLER